ncbi:hypothetical protein [Tenacibaculum bernardetii]|uniref:hypothetical protein n=1 Tax=Tenacibaculum bernardetii TaxID=3021375 RepID=UPI0023AFAE63|nr:hypothetical protein [Tenacibaculum bernardetii]
MLKPQNLFTITKAKEKRKKRQFLQNSVALGGNVRDTSENEILFKLKKLENNIYEIILEEKLEKGEYGIIPALNNGQVAMTYNYTFKNILLRNRLIL